jgi:hypothetical protein
MLMGKSQHLIIEDREVGSNNESETAARYLVASSRLGDDKAIIDIFRRDSPP